MHILLTWNDTRLAEMTRYQINPFIDERHQSCYWLPKFNAQELKAMRKYHEEMTKAHFYISPLGTIVTSTYYRFVVACAMHLGLYPVDIQRCRIEFYTIYGTGFKIKFGTNYGALTNDFMSDLTYDMIYARKLDTINREYYSSQLTLEFVFARRLPLYLMTTYFPSSLVTIVSFTSFWINPDAVPGRVTLGVTCLLALITQMTSVRGHLMNTNYVTAIDIWFLACITFVAFSLFGFAVSYITSRNQKIQYMRVNVRKPSKLTRIRWKLQKLTIDQWSRGDLSDRFRLLCCHVCLDSVDTDSKAQERVH